MGTIMTTIFFQVRMIIDKFGLAAVRNAWYDPKQVDDHVLLGYTKVIPWQLVVSN